VKDLSNITLQSVFNTLTPSGAATDISNVSNISGWTFAPFVMAVDTAMRYGLNKKIIPEIKSLQYRITMAALVNGNYFRGSELAFIDQFLEPTDDYHNAPDRPYTIKYTTLSSKYSLLSDGTSQQYPGSTITGYGPRAFVITFANETSLNQVYVGSTDGGPNNNGSSYDKTIGIEYWNGSEYLPHSIVNWETLPDIYGVTKATSSDGFFPWQLTPNKTEANRIYPLIGSNGKQILRYNKDTREWYHYIAYAYSTPYNSSFTNKYWNFSAAAAENNNTAFDGLGNTRVY